MSYFNFVFFIAIFSFCTKIHLCSTTIERINQLVLQWAPLIWMSPEEKYFPAAVEPFLKFVELADRDGHSHPGAINKTHFESINTDSLFLTTTAKLDDLTENNNTFLNGCNPSFFSVPIYAVVEICNPYISFHSSTSDTISNNINILYGTSKENPVFHVTYWTFYPYNKGKDICFIGKVPTFSLFGTCFGHFKTIGSHVGDWEHVSLFFNGKGHPVEMYISIHNTGAYYKYDTRRQYFKHDSKRVKRRTADVQKPKLPPIIRVQNGHSILFSAEGSHGLWPAPGEHEYVKIPRLTDKTGYGVPWKTWNNLIVIDLHEQNIPNWMYYQGKWGNPSNKCVISKKLGLCEHTDGPTGILRKKKDFTC